MNVEEERVQNVINGDSLLVLDDVVYYLALYTGQPPFDEDHAYLDGEYYYLYRGKKRRNDMEKPGIYIDSSTNEVVLIPPSTPEEMEYYKSNGKISTFDPASAAKLINENENLFIPVSDNCKIFSPKITVKDDILKRILKMLFKEKEIDIDQCKDRFPDKNAFFNFKQVMKGDANVTMKIFQRACDVIDVEYIIIARDRKSNNSIGKPVDHDIVVSSEDTYDYGTIPIESDDETEED